MLTRYDGPIDFDWGTGSPDASIDADTFSVRWEGKVYAPQSATYTFYTYSDDGVKLWVNDTLLINDWNDHGPTERSATISLTGGQRYNIVLEYYENTGGALVQLKWQYGMYMKQLIPLNRLYPDYTAPGGKPGNSGPGSGGRADVGAGVSTISGVATLYIGGIYEEVLTDPSHAYISYYSFGGKLVGMRRANQGTGGNDGQYRIVGDHLGSTSLVVDASTSPQVVSRQYYKPYGAVAWGWGSVGMAEMTTVGYTAQRVDVGSGLMYYGARFYDPVLSFFVSADTIAPDPADAKDRERYAYTLNNPLKYVDQTGHDPCNTDECKRDDAKSLLNYYGFDVQDNQCGWFAVNVDGCEPFSTDQLEWMVEAIQDFMNKAQITDVAKLKELLGTDKNRITLRYTPGADSNTTRGATITMQANEESGKDYFKYAFVHELGHAWDNNRGGALADEMHSKFYDSDNSWCHGGGRLLCDWGDDRSRPKAGQEPVSSYGTVNRQEDFAEAVAAAVYPNALFVLSDGHTAGYWNKKTGAARIEFVLDKMHGH